MGYCSPFLIDLFKMSRDETQKYVANQIGTYKMDVFYVAAFGVHLAAVVQC